MKKRLSMLLILLVLSIISVLLAAKYPTGPNMVSYDDPLGLWLSVGVTGALFLVPIILSFFNHTAVKVISTVYQAMLILPIFVGLIPVGFIANGSIWVSVIGLIGAVLSISSMVVTIKNNGVEKKNSSS